MVPDLDLQLQTAIKALSDNVTPAVDPADKVATEQLQLVIATLAMVRERLPAQRRFIRRLMEADIAMALHVAGAVPEGLALEGAADRAQAALRNPELEASELEEMRAELTSKIVSEIAGAGSAGLAALAPIVLEGAKPSLERLRSWCLPSGFEPDSSKVKPLDALL